MNDIFKKTSEALKNKDLNILETILDKPWGGFILINEEDVLNFANIYFNDFNINDLKNLVKFSPKILIIAPKKRLSWQYHHRRSEIWRVISGKIKVITSHDDIERKEKILKKGDEIRLSKGERHRIIGIDEYAVVAEIWIHADKDNPSDENDIVRVQDDFNRN